MKILNIKKIIIILIILLLITLLGIISIIISNNKQKPNTVAPVYDMQPEEIIIQELEDRTVFQKVKSRNEFYKVKKCIEKYYTSVNNKNQKAIYNILDDDYISFKGITLENLESKIEIVEHSILDISKMYVCEVENSTNIYYVSGDVLDYINKTSTNFSLLVKTDARNNTFKILLDDYIKQKYGELKIGDKITINTENPISDLAYNTYKNETITEEQYIIDVFKIYVNNILYNLQGAYNKIDEEYRNERFPSLEEFKKYIEEVKSKFEGAEIHDYNKYEYEGYIQYKCITTRGDNFIINEINPIDYQIMLDTYTIDSPSFTSSYKNTTDKGKINLNVIKIKTALKEKNYKYIYSKLNNEFRNNKFPTYEVFKNYCVNSIINNLKINDTSIEFKDNSYFITFTADNNEYFTFLMRLADDTNFEILFEIKQ